MPHFKDNNGCEWRLAIDVTQIIHVREGADPKFLKDDDEANTFARLQSDPVLLCGVIHALCKKEREERGVTDEQFYMHVIGDAIDAATDALLEAIVSFTPRLSRELLKVSAAKNAKIREIATARAIEKISDPRLEELVLAKVDAAIDSISTRLSSASSMPES